MSRSLRAPAAAVFIAAASLLTLAACTPAADSGATPKPTAGSSDSASASPSASPSAPAGTPVDVPCDTLVSPQTVYDFNSNFVLVDTKDLPKGSAAARAVADDGVACVWQNTTDNTRIYVSAARYPDTEIADLKTTAGTATDAFTADAGYFSGTTATAFRGDAWIVADSVVFSGAGDAKVFIDSAATALG